MAKFFSMLNSPRFGVAIGLVCIAFGVFGIINNYTLKTNSSDWFIVTFSCVIICGALQDSSENEMRCKKQTLHGRMETHPNKY